MNLVVPMYSVPCWIGDKYTFAVILIISVFFKLNVNKPSLEKEGEKDE